MTLRYVSSDLLAQCLKGKYPQKQAAPSEILIREFLEENPAFKAHYEAWARVNISCDDDLPVPSTAEEGRTIESGEANPQLAGEIQTSSNSSGAPSNGLKCDVINVEAEPDNPNPKQCDACGLLIPDIAKFCPECGAIQTASPTSSSEQNGERLPEYDKICTRSEAVNPAEYSYCTKCGDALCHPIGETTGKPLIAAIPQEAEAYRPQVESPKETYSTAVELKSISFIELKKRRNFIKMGRYIGTLVGTVLGLIIGYAIRTLLEPEA
jgi:hypothetical protein